MKKSISPWIAQLHFDNAKNSTWSAGILNLVLFVFYLAWLTSQVLNNGHAMFALSSAVILMILSYWYSWKNPELNLFILALYILSVAVEYYFLGLQDNPLGFSKTMSKGIALEMAVSMFPMLYYTLRIIAIIPLIFIYPMAKKLERIVG